MGCKKQQEIRSGNTVTIKCINRSCKNFGKEVSRDHCDNVCPMVVLDQRLHRSVERKPDMGHPEPEFDGGILKCNYTPSGFEEVSIGRQKCQYPECDSLIMQASLTKDGKIKFHFYCAGKPTTLKDCKRCQNGEAPSFLKQAKNYMGATTNWVSSGMPERSDEECLNILNNFCIKCEHYDKAKGRCNICGCKLNTSPVAFANKIRMATEHCPKGKW